MRIDTSLACIGLPVGGVASLSAAAPTPTPAPSPSPLTKLVAEGDSITVAAGSYAELWAAANPGVPFANLAESGDGIAQLNARLSAMMATEDPSHLTVMIGANDLATMTAEDWLDDLEAYFAAARAIKPGLVIGACGILPADEGLSGYTGFNAKRATANAAMRAAVGDWIDFYIPVGDHPMFDDAAALNPALSNDGLHWAGSSGLAYPKMAEVYGAVMDSILAEATGTAPGAFAFTDNANAPPDSVQTATVIVSGLGPGAIAATSTAGDGDYAIGRAAFGMLAGQVMNGDTVTARLTAGPDAEDAVSQTVTIGGVSDSFDVTTAAAEPAGFTAHAAQAETLGFVSTAHTFTVAFDAGYPVVALYKDTAIGGVNVNGEGATQITVSGGVYLYIGPSELAAGSHTVEVTGANQNKCAIFPGTLSGIGGSTPTGSAKLPFVYRGPGDQEGDASITVPSGGILVLFGFSEPQVTGYYTNALELAYALSGYSPSGGPGYFWAKGAASGVPKFAMDGYGNTALFAAGFSQ